MPVPTEGWGSFRPVREIVERAKAQGCEERRPQATVITPWGKKKVRYLYNPQTGGRYDISDFEDDEFMALSTIQSVRQSGGSV